MLTLEKIKEKLKEVNRLDLLPCSAIGRINFQRIVKDIDFKVVVEIGTYKGFSTAILASKADMVYTFDVKYQPETEWVWETFGVKDKIKYFVIGKSKFKDKGIKDFEFHYAQNNIVDHKASRQNIANIIENLDFDFAFIDGNHTYKDAKADFEIVKRCGRVLFDDNCRYFSGVQQFCKEIGVKTIGDFGYWQGDI